MNIILWILQVLLGLHTLAGAGWKFSKGAAETMPSLGAIPGGVWMGMSVVEILCGLVLVLPFLFKPLGRWVPAAAACIAAEMLLFCVLHMNSGDPNYGPMIYWLVVAALCAFVAYGRWKLKPL